MDVFVYGTLADPERAAAVLGEFSYCGPAVLDGLHRVDGSYPTLAPGSSVGGRILRTERVAALDRYEGVDGGLYVRATAPLADEENGPLADDATVPGGSTVEVYVGDPERLDAPADWPGSGSFHERVRSHLRERGVVVRGRPEVGEC